MTDYLLYFFTGVVIGITGDLLFSFFLKRHINSTYDQEVIKEDIQCLHIKLDHLSEKISAGLYLHKINSSLVNQD